jgi:hypothetical protein
VRVSQIATQQKCHVPDFLALDDIIGQVNIV